MVAAGDLAIKKRIQSANWAFFGQQKQLRLELLSSYTKFMTYKDLSPPSLVVYIYGNETWVLTKWKDNR
jgi:hypothetical protein